MERAILHVDLDNFYAAVECLFAPELKGVPMAVGGDESQRRGVILAKNYQAKKLGIKTGESLVEARKKCPGLKIVLPHFTRYSHFSHLFRQILLSYSDQMEPFGIDEAWLDVTASKASRGDGLSIARAINSRVKEELGVTASVGVSYNKVFAKLASGMDKPDGVTVIDRENYQELVWREPLSRLIYAGPATQSKLARCHIYTIGALANCQPLFLKNLLGKAGELLWLSANGRDEAAVARITDYVPAKSLGNSITTLRDLQNEEEVKIVFHMLAESVAARLREKGLRCSAIQILIRDSRLYWLERQGKLDLPSSSAPTLVLKAMELFRAHYDWRYQIRSLGLRGLRLAPLGRQEQLCLFGGEEKRQKAESLDEALDSLRARFGFHCIQRLVNLENAGFFCQDPEEADYSPLYGFQQQHGL